MIGRHQLGRTLSRRRSTKARLEIPPVKDESGKRVLIVGADLRDSRLPIICAASGMA